MVSLVETEDVTAGSDDFAISRMSFQARYRWEIAPLSDLFFVYTRGGNLARTFAGGGDAVAEVDGHVVCSLVDAPSLGQLALLVKL